MLAGGNLWREAVRTQDKSTIKMGLEKDHMMQDLLKQPTVYRQTCETHDGGKEVNKIPSKTKTWDGKIKTEEERFVCQAQRGKRVALAKRTTDH